MSFKSKNKYLAAPPRKWERSSNLLNTGEDTAVTADENETAVRSRSNDFKNGNWEVEDHRDSDYTYGIPMEK